MTISMKWVNRPHNDPVLGQAPAKRFMLITDEKDLSPLLDQQQAENLLLVHSKHKLYEETKYKNFNDNLLQPAAAK